MNSLLSRALPSNDEAALRDRHIIDQMIIERAPTLLGAPVLGALGRAIFYPLLGYRDAVRVADEMRRRDGLSALGFLARELALQIDVRGTEHVPDAGAAIIVANHPTGIADGVVVHDVLARRRPDFAMFANRDAVRVAPPLGDVIIPVEWMPDRRSRARTKETLRATQAAFAAHRLLVMFPSGRLAYMNEGRLTERPWLSTAVSLARRHGAPIVPMHIDGRNSALFYAFSRLSDQLRDITLFHEVLNKRGTRYGVRLAPAIAPEALEGDAEEVTRRLQAHVESRFERAFH